MVNELVLFETEDRAITLSVSVDQDTVWLNRNQMAELFGRDRNKKIPIQFFLHNGGEKFELRILS